MNYTIEKKEETIKQISKYIKNKDAILIEKSIYDFCVEYVEVNDALFLFEEIYDTKLNEILSVLKNTKITTEIAKKIAFLKPEELNPEKYDKLIKKKEIQNLKKNDIKTSDAFPCSKCKKKRCQVSQRQSRSADEPETICVKCLECGHTFTIN
jgi:DNA-directed RNA polymerase subunit M/transcription elongation factor TFIIS